MRQAPESWCREVRNLQRRVFDARADQRNGFLVIAIENDVPLRSDEEKRRQEIGADVVDVARNMMRFDGLIPISHETLGLRRKGASHE